LNFKGGTGKSSLTENLAHALALEGKEVLILDLDRQGNASTTLLGGAVARPTLTQVLKGETSLENVIRPAKDKERVFVAPSDGELDTANAHIISHRAAYYALRKSLERLDHFDYILFDHAGAYTPVMEAGLLASHEMLIPCELEAYAVQGLFSMFQKLEETLVDHELRNAGIIPYNVDLRYGMARQYLGELRETFGGLILAPVRTDSNVPKAQSVQMTVFEYEREYKVKGRASDDFRTLALDLIEEGKGDE
jgi:chromosome partitioning protein